MSQPAAAEAVAGTRPHGRRLADSGSPPRRVPALPGPVHGGPRLAPATTVPPARPSYHTARHTQTQTHTPVQPQTGADAAGPVTRHNGRHDYSVVGRRLVRGPGQLAVAQLKI